MNKKQHIKTVDQLIHDDSFILWCLFPTEESEQVWIDDYLTLYAEEKENILVIQISVKQCVYILIRYMTVAGIKTAWKMYACT